jgi:hypothetical protein
MKKVLLIALVFAFLCMPVLVNTARAEKNASAALLSAIMPGTGEWFNSGWNSEFPWVECVVGHICFCFQLSSILDAANGNVDTGMRLDFWSAPVK